MLPVQYPIVRTSTAHWLTSQFAVKSNLTINYLTKVIGMLES